MKLSLAWIFDHIDGDWHDHDIEALVTQFNHKTAEIEGVKKISWKTESFALAKVVEVCEESVRVRVPEWDLACDLDQVADADQIGAVLVVHREAQRTRWAEFADFGINGREGVLAPVRACESDLLGEWKNHVEWEDVVIEVDNKSITHRPDMWSHRGFAREIAMLLGLQFKNEKVFLADTEVREHGERCLAGPKVQFSIINETPDKCSRFSATYLTGVDNAPCVLAMSSRLLRVGAKPVNALVDLTNYMMLDWGQSVHAYDSDTIEDRRVVIRMAHPVEKITLLDGISVELTEEDLIIASGNRPMALAGVLGGLDHSIGKNTKNILLESAMFDAATVRRMALRHKVRTEASARFEKSPTPTQATTAVMRFLALAKQYDVSMTLQGVINAVGTLPDELIIKVAHSFLQERSGVKFTRDEVEKPLKVLGFGVQTKGSGDTCVYHVTVPNFRASKDIEIKEDILEEVVRCYGFEHLPYNVPLIRAEPGDLNPCFRVRAIKRYLTHGARMMEQANYSFVDEKFVQQLDFNPSKALEIINPVSQNSRRMVTTLIPGLLKNICDNYVEHDGLAFFEVGRSWNPESGKFPGETSPGEKSVVAGIVFEKRGSIDFYELKDVVNEVFSICGVRDVVWEKPKKLACPWMHPYQSADLLVDGVIVGSAGKVDAKLWDKLDLLPDDDAFVFELDAGFLYGYKSPVLKSEQISKFQESSFDLCFMVPVEQTVLKLEKAFRSAHRAIKSVRLIDFFEKDEWGTKRSIAFRFVCGMPDGTLSKDEIELVRQSGIDVALKCGATLRE